MNRRDEIRQKALKDLQKYEVLMLDGHFDFGNGYHGRVYLNPHQLFRHPSTIWRFAQDLIDVLPSVRPRADRSRGRASDRRCAARPYDCRVAGQPPRHHPSSHVVRSIDCRCRGRILVEPLLSTAGQGAPVLLVDDVRNTGHTLSRCAAAVRAAGGTFLATAEIYDRLEASSISTCRTLRWPSTRRRRTIRLAHVRCAPPEPQ